MLVSRAAEALVPSSWMPSLIPCAPPSPEWRSCVCAACEFRTGEVGWGQDGRRRSPPDDPLMG
eukprot:12275112-Alexandrium_andersonii.AAC.1